MQTQEHGGDVYSANYRLDFSTSVNPLGIPRSVKNAIIAAMDNLVNYPDIQCRSLRHALSEYYNIPVQWIICGNGAAELIFTVALAVRPGRALLVCPGFSEYEQALKAAFCQDIYYYPCSVSNGFKIEEDILESISNDIDMVYLCNPVNPTGILIGHDLMLRIAERCKENKVLLVLDECYNGLLEHPEEADMVKYVKDNPDIFILNAFTKVYAMPGIRIGYGISSNRLLIDKVRRYTQPWNVSVLAQAAGEAALKETDYVLESRALISREMQYLKRNFSKIGMNWYGSSANYLFFEGQVDLFDRCAERGILIRDCRNYRGLRPGYFRISVRTHRDNEELCGLLSDICKRKGVHHN